MKVKRVNFPFNHNISYLRGSHGPMLKPKKTLHFLDLNVVITWK